MVWFSKLALLARSYGPRFFVSGICLVGILRNEIQITSLQVPNAKDFLALEVNVVMY